MSGYLLDVNALISLVDPMHAHHRRAMAWFRSEGMSHWMTCPTTENGVVRIISNPKYPQAGIGPVTIIEVLRRLTKVGHHTFMPDRISLLDEGTIHTNSLRRSNQVTDTYLLALTASVDAELATCDQRIATDTVPRGRVVLIP